MTIEQSMQLAREYHYAGRLPQAEAIYRQVLAQQPNHFEALHLLGMIAMQVGKVNPAIELLRRALAVAPNNPAILNDLGNMLNAEGESEPAIEHYRAAIAIRPDFTEAHYNLGRALHGMGQSQLAIEALQKAIVLRPNFPEARNNLGNALRASGNLDRAIAEYRKALELSPGLVEARSNLGAALSIGGRFDDAIAALRQTLSIAPDHALAHHNLGMTLLLLGHFREGWQHYEWRLKVGEFQPIRRNLIQPIWDGSELGGRRILLHAEQGFGDTIQFARYVPLVASRGGKVLLSVPGELSRLMRDVSGVERLITNDETASDFDLHAPLLSLPRLFDTTLESIPKQVSYLKADPELALRWRQQMPPGGFKVGLAWAGRASHQNDRRRSIALEALAPLGSVVEASFYSLQTTRIALAQFPITDWTKELNDFADTAALIENLDLIISVDTAVAHLAAAMGKRVWLLLPFVPDWRWLLHRDDSPWYPTMKLFRQTQPDDWETPIERVAEALRSEIRGESR